MTSLLNALRKLAAENSEDNSERDGDPVDPATENIYGDDAYHESCAMGCDRIADREECTLDVSDSSDRSAEDDESISSRLDLVEQLLEQSEIVGVFAPQGNVSAEVFPREPKSLEPSPAEPHSVSLMSDPREEDVVDSDCNSLPSVSSLPVPLPVPLPDEPTQTRDAIDAVLSGETPEQDQRDSLERDVSSDAYQDLDMLEDAVQQQDSTQSSFESLCTLPVIDSSCFHDDEEMESVPAHAAYPLNDFDDAHEFHDPSDTDCCDDDPSPLDASELCQDKPLDVEQDSSEAAVTPAAASFYEPGRHAAPSDENTISMMEDLGEPDVVEHVYLPVENRHRRETASGDQTLVTENIPSLWQALSKVSFESPADRTVDLEPEVARAGEAKVEANEAQTIPANTTSAEDSRATVVPHRAAQAVSAVGRIDRAREKKSTDERRGHSSPQRSATRLEPSSLDESSAPIVPRRERTSSVQIANATPKAMVPRKVSAANKTATQYEESLRRALRNEQRSRQLVDLHGRMLNMVPSPGSCAVITVQRDPEVSEILSCLGILHTLKKNRPVLLLDANAEQHFLTDNFGLADAAGISDVCNGASDWGTAVHQTSIAHLSVMPLGTTIHEDLDPTKALAVLTEMKKNYDLVLVDVGHAHAESYETMSKVCDRLFIQVKLGRTMREMAKNVADMLFSNNLTISGVIVTNAPSVTKRN